MIGTNPNLPFPQLTDTYSQMVGKVAAWLSAIGVSLADRATPSALNINTALDFGGNAAINITSVQLAGGNTPSVPGAIFYDSGEFYAIDSTGIIQLTSNGQLNAASVGGIGGDYGGVNPAKVVYDNASGQYRFYTNGSTGAWAELAAAKLLLEGAAATVELGVDASLAISRILNIKSLPSSGVGMLVYNSTTSTIEDMAATSPTVFTVTCPITATDLKWTTAQPHQLTAANAETGGAHAFFGKAWFTGASTAPIYFPVDLPVGCTISGSNKSYFRKATNSTVTLTGALYKCDCTTGVETQVSAGWTNSGNATGFQQITDLVSTPVTITSGFSYYYKITPNSTVTYGDELYLVEIQVTR